MSRRTDRTVLAAAAATLALVVGVGSATVSACCAPGGRGPWLVVAVKGAAAVLPLAALRARPGPGRVIRVLAWAAAGGLTAYGFVRTTAALLAGLVLTVSGARADTALVWQTVGQDPWLLLWGLLAAVALLVGRPPAADPVVTRG